MKNMFFVINKEKVYAYVVSILTIVTLFFMSHILNTDISGSQETAANIINAENLNCNENLNTDGNITINTALDANINKQ